MPNYLYNGIELPALPDYDKTQYPYVYISRFYTYILDKWQYYVLFTSSPYYGYSSGKGEYCIGYRKGAITYYLIEGDATWGHQNTWDTDGVFTELNTLVWANFNVLNEDGSVYLPASDPIPVPDEPEKPDEPAPVLSWKKHDAYKLNSKSIAYLYNGVELPDINTVWTDKATFPCAIIVRGIPNGTYYLTVCGDKPYYTEQSYGTEGYEPIVVAPKPFKGFSCVGGSWVLNTEDTGYGAALRTGTFELIWTNVDVMNKDNGSVYFNGSDPVIKGWDGNTFYRVMGGKWVKQDAVNSLIKVEPDTPEPEKPANCLTFSSAEPFTISVNNMTKNWDGTLYYSTDTETWSEWDGTTQVQSAEHGTEQRIYMRGSGNTKITGSYLQTNRWVLTGDNVSCHGNIENILDYEMVSNGVHPQMANACYVALFNMWEGLVKAPDLGAIIMTPYCYYEMFDGCTNLVAAPELPSISLEDRCYYSMFANCKSIKAAPQLPATELYIGCYLHMFANCTGLTIPPELPAENLEQLCYNGMFAGCTGLVALPKLKATNIKFRCYESMFERCTSIKLSETQTGEYQTPYRIPTSGTGVMEDNALWWMFDRTGGTFVGEPDIVESGTPKINKTYYTSNTVV